MLATRRTTANLGRTSFIPRQEILDTHTPCKMYFAIDTNALYLTDQENNLHTVDVDDLVTEGSGITVTGNIVSIRNASGLTNLCIPAWNTANGQIQNTPLFSDGLGLAATAALRFQAGAHANVDLFDQAASGETRELRIFGFRAADAARSLEIGVGVDAADTVSFDGLSNYVFDGRLGVGTVAPGTSAQVIKTGAAIQDVMWLSNKQAVAGDVGVSLVFTGTAGDSTIGAIGAAFEGAATTDGGYMVFITRAVGGTPTEWMRIEPTGFIGVNVTDPDTRFEIFQAGTQLKLSFDGTDNCTFAVDTDGDLTITPSGSTVEVTKDTTGIIYNVNATTAGQATMNIGGYWNGTTVSDLIGGTQVSLQNKHNTAGNYSYISNLDKDANVVSAIAFVNVSHANHVGDMVFLTKVTGGNIAEKVRITSAGNLGIGIATYDATAVGYLTIVNGTEPAAHTDNQIYIGSKDSADNTATLAIYAEQAVEAGAPTFDNKLKIWINGTAYFIGLDAV